MQYLATKTAIWPCDAFDKRNEMKLLHSGDTSSCRGKNQQTASSRGALVRVRGVDIRNRAETIQQQILKRQLFFRQYYPEGEWGYIILVCAFLCAIISQGVLLSIGLLSLAAERIFFRRFFPDVHHNYAGKSWGYITFLHMV